LVKNYTIVGLGELLWDLFPQGKQLGGAPANFAYITSLLGDSGIVASRLGSDSLGKEAREQLQRLGLETSFVQHDSEHPTGTVKVQFDRKDQPRFHITESVAWDYLKWTPQWQALAAQADAVCFGSLAQRCQLSRETIGAFIKSLRPSTVRVFDANLRQNFYSLEVVSESLRCCDVFKVNQEELPRVMQLLGLQHVDDESSSEQLKTKYGPKLVCVTRGAEGSFLLSDGGTHEHAGLQVEVRDTVGAGDAFTAGLTHCYLRRTSLAKMNEVANRMGAWVASQAGGTPVAEALNLAELRSLAT
jgi:fructokinase